MAEAEMEPRTQALIDTYGGEENMKAMGILSLCEVNAMQIAKLRTYLSWPNERHWVIEQRLEDLAEFERLESTCTDPYHDTIQHKYSKP